MPFFKRGNPGCAEASGCLCQFCGCGTYTQIDLTMLGGGGDQIIANGLEFQNKNCAGGPSYICEWEDITTSVSLSACGTPPASFWVVVRFRWNGTIHNKCSVDIELWDSALKTTNYGQLYATNLNCCGAFATVAFTQYYTGLSCNIPSTVSLSVSSLVECDESPACGTNPPCPGSVEDPVDVPDSCPVNCCPDPPAQMEVDLGAGGLTDGTCCAGGNCAAVASTYSLDPYHSFGGDCYWKYSEEDWCPIEAGCKGDCGVAPYGLLVIAWVDRATCKLKVLVTPFGKGGTDDATDCPKGWTIYESTDILDSTCVGSWTLNKFDEEWDRVCSGSLPASITVTSL